MDVVASPQASRAEAAPAPTAHSVLSSDFETFITMLTAQMENQDPLNPLDSQDFATQLATFSGVEQQVKTNDLLSALASQLLTSSLGDMASWVGMDARIAAPAHFDGAAIELVANPPKHAERAELVVTNEAGSEVQRVSVPVSDQPISWAGVGSSGQPLASGTYSFKVEAFSKDEQIDSHVPDIFTRVSEIRTVDQTAVVVVKGDAIHPASLVTGLRQ